MRIRPFHMILALVMAGSMLLAACGKPAAMVSETGGVERAVVQQSAEALKPLETEAEEETREPMPTDNPSVDVTEVLQRLRSESAGVAGPVHRQQRGGEHRVLQALLPGPYALLRR